MSQKKTNSNPSPILSESLDTVPQLDTEAGLKVGIFDMEHGWIKLHRKSLDHWLYNEKRPLTKREAWENILLLANHSKIKVLIKGELIDCDRGQSVMSLQSWADEFRWSRQMVRTFFDLLKKDGMINTEGLHNSTRITVCNYEYYQSSQHADNTPNDIKQHALNTRSTTNKNDKNIYSKKESNKERKFYQEPTLPQVADGVEGSPLPEPGNDFEETKMAELPPLSELKKKYEKIITTPRGAGLRLAKYMYDKLVIKYPDHKTIKEAAVKRWVEDADLLIRVDKIEGKKAVEIFDWAMQDSFWSSIVRSPGNLRKNLDSIRAKMDRPVIVSENQKREPQPPKKQDLTYIGT